MSLSLLPRRTRRRVILTTPRGSRREQIIDDRDKLIASLSADAGHRSDTSHTRLRLRRRLLGGYKLTATVKLPAWKAQDSLEVARFRWDAMHTVIARCDAPRYTARTR